MTISNATQLICFFILSIVVILGGLGVVLLPNIVYAAFLLGGVFLSVAGFYLLLNASFVAAAQILIYVGAVNVLILFAIMLVNRDEELVRVPGLLIRRLLSGVICVGLLGLLVRAALVTPWAAHGPIPLGEEATTRIGEHLFSDYLLPFELASVLLLIAMVGAIVLARREGLYTETITSESTGQRLLENANISLLPENTPS
ncbi:NADH dehydrogenase subunit J (chromatophore) [Paulinella micropora]|uniref:NADH dehydrogenase subunit J n=1 Tax=Paulinella micropora TaxID=1928728 RepID=A0A1L5YBM3_9EUKA|nr:NADH dehydrogenase subunit J [Paulinella micropora]AQX44874.1 NADH dehydrogenase subunit J [Paulinella micropora]BBL86088.1 NADH dehydrogenase subunit J [Paulinella micropora]